MISFAKYSVNGAISSAEQRGDPYAAIAISEEHGRFVKGVNIALRIGDLERANRLYERAIQKAERTGDFSRCAEIARIAEKPEMAELFSKIAEFRNGKRI